MSAPPDGKTESRRLAAENAPKRPRMNERAATEFGNVRSQKLTPPPQSKKPGMLKRIRGYIRNVAPDAARTALDPLYAYRGRDVERFMLTIGYNRSGTSLIGQLLNAHSEIVVSHNLYVLQKLRALRFVPTLSARGRVTRLIIEKDREAGRASYRESGYSYAVSGLWQGRYSRLRVIGDKGAVSSVAGLSAAWGPRALDLVRLPARVLFTIRSPYDVIASRVLNRSRDLDGADIPPLRDYAPADSERANIGEQDIRWFLDLSENISRVLAMFPEEDVLPTRYEDFIASPKESLRQICAFLSVSEDEDYLDACAAFTLRERSLTRLKVRWTDAQIDQIAAAIEKYPWLLGYNFDS